VRMRGSMLRLTAAAGGEDRASVPRGGQSDPLVVTSFWTSLASAWRLDPATSTCSCWPRRSTSLSRTWDTRIRPKGGPRPRRRSWAGRPLRARRLQARIALTPDHRASSYAHELGSQERKLGRIERVPDAGVGVQGSRRWDRAWPAVRRLHGPQAVRVPAPVAGPAKARRPSQLVPGPRGGSGHPGGLARPAPPQPLERRERALVQRLERPRRLAAEQALWSAVPVGLDPPRSAGRGGV
jgi:hypothetical protein